jgi:flagellar basal body rod protein FlgG
MGSYGESALVRGLSFLAEKQAAIANNLANVDTTSFKRRATIARESTDSFHNMLDAQLTSLDYVETNDMQRGVLRQTDNRFDVAIDGPSWLRVRNAAGVDYYTRNGQLQIGTDGRLTTRTGMTVLDQRSQPISLGTAEEMPDQVSFSPNGTLTDPSTGRTWGPIAMVDLPNQAALVPVGSSLYLDPKGQAGTQASDGLRQGFLEGSNVDSLQELVQMISVERTFAATQKALSGIGRLQENMITNLLR